MIESPVEHGNLRECSRYNAYYLYEEELSRRNLRVARTWLAITHQTLNCIPYIAVYAQLEVLGEGEALGSRNIAQIEEPNIRQDLALPDIPGHKAAKDVDLHFDIGRGIKPCKLFCV